MYFFLYSEHFISFINKEREEEVETGIIRGNNPMYTRFSGTPTVFGTYHSLEDI